MSKSSSIAVEKGREMSDMGGVNVALRAKSITGGITKVLEKFREKKRNLPDIRREKDIDLLLLTAFAER